MDFTSQDIVIIEQALQNAIKSQGESGNIRSYQEVLSKLKTNAAAAMQSTKYSLQDGFRFDYDDSSDLL